MDTQTFLNSIAASRDLGRLSGLAMLLSLFSFRGLFGRGQTAHLPLLSVLEQGSFGVLPRLPVVTTFTRS